MTRPMTRRALKITTAAALATTMAVGLAACTTSSDNPDVANPPSFNDVLPGEHDLADSAGKHFVPNAASIAGPPLPANSIFEPAGSVPASAISTEDLEGSLRPDDRKPEQRIQPIYNRKRIIVGVDQSHNLLSYRDTASGELRGFEVDLAHEIARDIFGDPSKVDFKYIEASDRENALNSGAVDIVIRTMTITAERQRQVEFSIPYLTTQTRMLVMKDSDITSMATTTGKTICASAGSTAVDRIRLEAPDANILATRGWGDCLMALQLHQVDAVVTDDTLLSGMVDQDPYTKIVGDPIATETYGVGIRKPDREYDSTGLVRQVNYTLERIRRDGTWQRMYNEWFADYLPNPTLPPIIYREEDDD